MIKAAVLGSPIQHSLSPALHARAYEILGIHGDYKAIEVTEDQLGRFLSGEGFSFDGLSLTMPLKECALQYCAHLSDDVRTLGALNTLVAKDGSWSGSNTDVLGFELLLKSAQKSDVAILGAGGTARAALLACTRLGLTPTIYRRNHLRDESLRSIAPSVEIRDWRDLSYALQSSILINATPQGAIVVDQKVESSLVLDSLYHPWPTDLSKKLEPSSEFISGIELLAAQATFQVELMVGIEVDHAALKKELVETASRFINS
jgi:shikimate dehydrogenase